MYGDIDLGILKKIFNDYLSGLKEVKYGFNITHITKELRALDIVPILEMEERKKAQAYKDHFYGFQGEPHITKK